MKKILIIILILTTQNLIGQNDGDFYLLIDNPIFGYRYEKDIGTGFILKSKNKQFQTDYFSFDIQNVRDFSETGIFDYYTLKELRKEIDISKLNYETISSLTKNKEWWQVHNELSLKKNIYLLEKRKEKFNSQTGKWKYGYYILPMIYEGTRKDVVPTDLSSDRN